MVKERTRVTEEIEMAMPSVKVTTKVRAASVGDETTPTNEFVEYMFENKEAQAVIQQLETWDSGLFDRKFLRLPDGKNILFEEIQSWEKLEGAPVTLTEKECSDDYSCIPDYTESDE